MSIWDRLFGRRTEPEQSRQATENASRQGMSADEQAIERYRYLLRTAPPETIEQAHAEAFTQLTPEQRQMVLQQLSQDLPESERAAALRSGDDPRALARTATRAELRNPGTLERRFSGIGAPGMGMGYGGLMASSFLSTIAGVVVGSAIADAFFADSGDGQSDGGDDSGDGGSDGDSGDDSGADGDGGDTGDGDLGDGGFDSGDFGGDFGGGDFGGGDL